jgi:predicted glycosyltransferase involved in capsule biosynthesis
MLRNSFIKSFSENAEFITIEDDVDKKIYEYLDDDDIYAILNNSGDHTKNSAYNLGATFSTRKYMVFLDVDCIMHPILLHNILSSNDKSIFDKLIFPYNRVAFYLTPYGKNMYQNNPTYHTLKHMLPNVIRHKASNKYGHIYANCPGGAYLMTHDFFNKINGFNPNFRGWGYEDSELVERVNGLGVGWFCLSARDNVLYHLHHGDTSISDTMAREKYINTVSTQHNKYMYDAVTKMNKIKLEEYTKTWTL